MNMLKVKTQKLTKILPSLHIQLTWILIKSYYIIRLSTNDIFRQTIFRRLASTGTPQYHHMGIITKRVLLDHTDILFQNPQIYASIRLPSLFEQVYLAGASLNRQAVLEVRVAALIVFSEQLTC